MPEQYPLKNQKGSTFVGVVALCSVMTIAAGGFLLQIGNASKDLDFAKEDRGLHYAAESGMLMGVSWTRCHFPIEFDPNFVGPTYLTGDSSSAYFENMDGYLVKVLVHGNPISPFRPRRILHSFATLGLGKDTVELKWSIDSLPLPASLPGINSTPTMINWMEYIHPGKP